MGPSLLIEVRAVMDFVDFLRVGVLRQGVFRGRHDFFLILGFASPAGHLKLWCDMYLHGYGRIR